MLEAGRLMGNVVVVVLLFVVAPVLAGLAVAQGWPWWAFVPAVGVWAWPFVAGFWGVLRGRIGQRDLDDNPTPWYTP